MDLYSTASGGGVPTLSHASAQLDPLYLPDLGDFDAKNDLMDCGMGFSFPELGSLGGMDFDKLDQLVRMEADLERIERLERLEVEIGSLETEMEDQQLIHSLSGASAAGRWSLTDNLMESNFTSSYGVAAAIDSDSTDIIVNPLSVLPVTSTSSSNSVTLNSGWTSFLQQPAVNVPSPIPASPASPVVVPKLVKQMSTSSDSGAGFPKPGYSYSCLIALALKNSKSGCLPVSEIYRFMCEHFPYFRTAPAGWKNSVRHNLSLNKCFEKVERVVTPSTNNAATRKGCLWTLNPAKAAKMDEEVLKWSRKDPSAIKRAMAYPEALELLERGEMKMDFAGGASTEEEDEGEGPEEENDCSSPLGTVAQPEPSPPLKTENEQLNVGVSILSHVRRNSTTSAHSKHPQPKVYYSFPTKSYQSASSELVIIGESV